MGSEDENGRRERRSTEALARRDLAAHNSDAYAHAPMINRLMQENVTLRERFENRLSALERFRAQATLLGGLGLVVLGAVAGVVALKVLQ